MVKQYLMAFVKAYRAAADTIEGYIKSLEDMGVDLDNDLQDANLVVEIATTCADKTMEETFKCEVYGDASTVH